MSYMQPMPSALYHVLNITADDKIDAGTPLVIIPDYFEMLSVFYLEYHAQILPALFLLCFYCMQFVFLHRSEWHFYRTGSLASTAVFCPLFTSEEKIRKKKVFSLAAI